jgi:hypothetical protein
MLVGLRGVGKTVLLNRILEIAEADGFIAAIVETPESKGLAEILVPTLRKVLLRLDTKEKVNEAVKRGLMVLRAFAKAVKVKVGDLEVGLSIDPERGTADTGDIETDLPDMFEALGQAARSRGTAVVIIIDEIQYIEENEFSALIMAMHRISQKQLPVVLIGAGLPQLVGLAGKSKSYAERLFDYPEVGALSLADATKAIREPANREGVEFTEDAVRRVVELTKGYPYFLQEWGAQSWNAAEASPITEADIHRSSEMAIASLDESFFRVRFDRLSPRERDYMFAMARLGSGPHRSGDVASELEVAVESIAPVRSSLIKKGMIYSPAHGDTAFTVPMFDQYLMRMATKRTPETKAK